MARNKLLSLLVLYPMSKIYGMVTAIRNQLFDRGVLKQQEFDVPVVVVGNLAVGGTGKTPHVEYLAGLFRDRYKCAVLSRGYRRHTHGYVVANQRSTPEDIGDEPYQIYQKYGNDVTVAVCEKRVEGINRLREVDPAINMMILDDAFQHRYVKPMVSIVLTEYSRPFFSDHMLPYGRLRESVSAINRADVVVVTKCPVSMKPMEYRIFKEKIGLFPYQKLFFSRYVYGHLVPVFPEKVSAVPYLEWLKEDDAVLIVSGIANPRPFVRHIRRHKARVRLIRFHDHVSFSHADMQAIQRKFESLNGKRKFLITTEKDAVKLAHSPYFPASMQSNAFYLPVSVEFARPFVDEPDFDTTIQRLVATKQTL